MIDLLNQEYVHNGTNIIYKELWNKIYMNPENTGYLKPTGGLWTSHYTIDNLSDWLEYLKDYKQEMFEFALNKNNILLKLKKDTKLLTILNENDYKNLKDSNLTIKLDVPVTILAYYNYYTVTEIPDYEKLAYIYDAIYVNPHADISLYNYSIHTMLIINPDSINYFKQIDSYYDKKEKRVIAKNIGNQEKILNIMESYTKLVNIIKKDFYKKLESKSTLKELRKDLLENYMRSSDIDYLIQKEIPKYNILKTIIHNLEADYNKDTKKLLKK